MALGKWWIKCKSKPWFNQEGEGVVPDGTERPTGVEEAFAKIIDENGELPRDLTYGFRRFKVGERE